MRHPETMHQPYHHSSYTTIRMDKTLLRHCIRSIKEELHHKNCVAADEKCLGRKGHPPVARMTKIYSTTSTVSILFDFNSGRNNERSKVCDNHLPMILAYGYQSRRLGTPSSFERDRSLKFLLICWSISFTVMLASQYNCVGYLYPSDYVQAQFVKTSSSKGQERRTSAEV